MICHRQQISLSLATCGKFREILFEPVLFIIPQRRVFNCGYSLCFLHKSDFAQSVDLIERVKSPFVTAVATSAMGGGIIRQTD